MDKNEALLEEVYRNVKMGGDSIVNLIDKVESHGLRGEMTVELDRYRAFENRASELLAERGLKPKELSTAAKMGAKAGMLMNTMLDTSTSHLAELMINGSTMGIIELEKARNTGTHTDSARALAEDVLKFERESTVRLGKFL